MRKCIVVEDDSFWSDEISAVMNDAEVEVYTATDGKEALNLVRAHPDAGMVLDIILPDIDGVQVLLELKSLAPKMPVLAVSSGGRLGAGFYLQLASSFGARDQLAKPFTSQQLMDKWRLMAA